MARATVEDVRDAIETSLPDSEIASYIEDAALEVTERVAAAEVPHSDKRLLRLEKYLAAHLVRFLRERERTRDSIDKGDASITHDYTGAFGEGLRATPPGQTVLALDIEGVFGGGLGNSERSQGGFVRSTYMSRGIESTDKPL